MLINTSFTKCFATGIFFIAAVTLHAQQKLVVAVEMGVARTKEISGQWRTWQNGNHKPDNINEVGIRDNASVYNPSIGLHDDSDTTVIEYNYQLIKMCGIDAVSCYATNYDKNGDHLNEWYADKQKKKFKYLDKYGLKCFVRTSANDTSALTALNQIYKGDRILKIDNKRVFSFFSGQNNGDQLRVWKAKHGNPDPFFFLRWNYPEKISNQDLFDGLYDWIADRYSKDQRDTSSFPYKWHYNAEQARIAYDADIKRAKERLAEGELKYYAEGLCPGFDDIKINGWGKGPHYIERDNGRTYQYKWAKAVENGFPVVYIPTWDDWCENSCIAPTVEYGDTYLKITRKFAAAYKKTNENKANLMLPLWIYRIRKCSHNQKVLRTLNEACGLIQQSKYESADSLVKPLLSIFDVEGVKYWDTAISLSEYNVDVSSSESQNASPLSFTITKTGNSAVNYKISSSEEWLKTSNSGGIINSKDVATVKVKFKTEKLTKGLHKATITVSDPATCNREQIVHVNLKVQ